MVKDTKDLTVGELERLLDARKSEFVSLSRRKSKLERDLIKVQKRMALLEGRRGGPRLGRKFGKRPRNEKSLHETVVELLSKTKKGYPLAELADKILGTGYKSKSSDFKNVVYQCLYNAKEIIHDPETGTYRLK
jgi:hypothetical protein